MMKIAEASKAIGVSAWTLRRWANKGLVPAIRTPAGRLYWTQQQLQEIRQTMGAESVPMAAEAVAEA